MTPRPGSAGRPGREPADEAGRLSRRSLLAGAGAVAGSAALGALLADCGTSTATTASAWPQAKLTSRDAQTVDPTQFMPLSQLRSWSEELDDMGMRATGYPIHDRFVDTLIDRLQKVGVEDVHLEPVSFERWTVGRWALERDGSAVATASYVPYSGSTPADGIVAPIVSVDASTTPPPGSLRGKIALFDVVSAPVTYGTMESIAYGKYDPQGLLDPNAEYSRPWGGVANVIAFLDALESAGAVGCIGVVPLPAAGAHGSYYPYDGVVRSVPGVFVDAAVGGELRSSASGGLSVRLTLTATTEPATSGNVVGTITGASSEIVLLNSHTDGPNAVEDNGPNTIVAISQYLARLPREALPRTIQVSFTTGHFHGGIGQVTFAQTHRTTTIPDTACAITLEHLGALEWEENAEGQMALTGNAELGVVFVPENHAMVDAALGALRRADAGPALALRPYVATPGSPNGYGWPGEGTQLWTDGHLMTMNYITGPTYLLNWGIPTIKKTDFARMHREAVAFTEMVLALARTPRASLGVLDLPPL